MKIILYSHPHLRFGWKTFEIEKPCSVKELCDQFNIPLRFKPRRNGVGSDKAYISTQRTKKVGEDFILEDGDMLYISANWLYGCGPLPENFDFNKMLNELRADGRGIGGHPPYEELENFEDIQWIIGDSKHNE